MTATAAKRAAAPPTAAGCLRAAAARLKAASVDSPGLDSELLLAEVLGVSRTHLRAHPARELGLEEEHHFDRLVARRAAREPLPYLLGWWEFMGMRLRVTPAVLIPRPETEIVVESLVPLLNPGDRVLDVGTGSGCIALALARCVPGLRVVALEPSPAALAVARENASALGLEARITFVDGAFRARKRNRSPDWNPNRPDSGSLAVSRAGVVDSDFDFDYGFGPTNRRPSAERPRPFAAIAANAPYIPTTEIANLQPEVRDYEPRLALDGGPDGMSVLRTLAIHSAALLCPGGYLAMEVALGQARAAEALLARAGNWAGIRSVPDLAGIPRVVMGQRR